MRVVEQILDLARWAPSGDNTQPWRFEIVADEHVAVHASDTRDHCIYDLDGHASQLSVGAMLETLRLAATSHGLAATSARRAGSPETRPVFDVALLEAADIKPSSLVDAIRVRSVQRRSLSTRKLSSSEKSVLESSLPSSYSLVWIEPFSARMRLTSILWASARLRLTVPEAFDTHRRVIEWCARYSDDRIPDRAIGLDPATTKLMRWAMQDWRRIEFLNQFLAGTVLPRVQLDLVPGLACAAHVLILAYTPPETIDDYVAAGAAMQRFWLSATALGLQHQPEITPLIFSRYARHGRRFSATPLMFERAKALNQHLEALLSVDVVSRAVWMGRIGAGEPAASRSLRLPLDKLILSG
jgi:hypothetical protein